MTCMWDCVYSMLCCFHVKDLHRLCDHWTGVNLSIDAYYKGLVEQDVCVFCEKKKKSTLQYACDFGLLCFVMTNRWAPEWLLLTRWSSYLDREAQTLEDSWGQSVPHQSCHYPCSTWMLAGSLLPGCNRENLHHYIMKSKWKSEAQSDIVLLFIDLHMLPFSSHLICGGGLS